MRSTKFDTEVCGILAQARVRFARLGAESGAEERFVSKSICPCHMQARVAKSAFYRGPRLFSVRVIEDRTCDVVYIATVICMSNELPNNALTKNISRAYAQTLRIASEVKFSFNVDFIKSDEVSTVFETRDN